MSKAPTSTRRATITLAEVARSMKIDPKTARQKARRRVAEFKGALKPADKDSWTFAASQRDAVKKFLKS